MSIKVGVVQILETRSIVLTFINVDVLVLLLDYPPHKHRLSY